MTGPDLGPLATRRLLRDMPEGDAELARLAVSAVLPDGGALADLDQSTLQEFLWYSLPNKWMVPTEDLHDLARALGGLLASAGLDRYAALCRSEETHQLIDRWQVDREGARKTFSRMVDQSGVEPLDTGLIEWAQVFGIAEVRARDVVARALEEAAGAGTLRVGAPRWKSTAAAVVDATLTRAAPDGGKTLLTQLRAERSAVWAGREGTARAAVLRPVLAEVTPDDAAVGGSAASGADREGGTAHAVGCLEPLVWLLEQIGTGVMKTQAGYLPKALVLAANERYRWLDLPGFNVRTEKDLRQLARLHELARGRRLVTTSGRRVALSAKGRQALADGELLWDHVVRHVFDPQTFDGEGAALLVACLLPSGEPLSRSQVESRIAEAMTGRWRSDSGEPLGPRIGSLATVEVRAYAEIFGWLDEDGPWDSPRLRLTEAGRAAARRGLRHQAWGPHSRP